MKYDLTQPCDLCPFRNDRPLFVHPLVLAEMAQSEFCCHKTGSTNEATNDIEPSEQSQHCAGALIFLEKVGRPHQMMRIAERLGLYKPQKLKMDSPVGIKSTSRVKLCQFLWRFPPANSIACATAR